ncbi:MAG: prolyl oligopeptidase family serine peptidase [Ekhidna sp.]|uniref:alpha/beta hydrolase family protein n=1 Tax=Ekhidna sp. TaxID=2608089 RepID=UPI0032EC2CF8
MKRTIFIIVLACLFSGCTEEPSQNTIDELKASFSKGEVIKVKSIDYTQTPIYKKVKHHPEQYTHLDKVDFYSISYLSDGLLITGLMVTPKEDGSYPVIVFNRGGNRDLGRLLVGTSVDVLSRFAAKGYVVVASNYRGNSSTEGIEEFGGSDVNDVINLVKVLPEIPKADAEKVGLLGLSRGGMMNYLTLKGGNLTQIKAAAAIGGIVDLKITAKYHPEMTEVFNELIPDIDIDRMNALRSRSATYWVDELPKNVPLMILHSKADEHVSYEQIPPFLDSLTTYNVPFESVIYEDDTHGLTNYQDEVLQKIIEWFDKYLKLELQ